MGSAALSAFLLTKEAEHDGLETQFLIYSLAPGDEFKDETRARLSALSPQQLRCVVRFLEWLDGDPEWKEYCGDEITDDCGL